MKNKHFVRIIVTFGISVSILIGICILGVLGIREKRYYEKNYQYTTMKVSNFTVVENRCSIYSKNVQKTQKTYMGYINVTYNVNNILYKSSFTKDEFCTSSYISTLLILKERYHKNENFYIWY